MLAGSLYSNLLRALLIADRLLVLRQGYIDGFRASQKRQCKALSIGNGRPFSRTATPQWRFCEALSGRGDMRPSALLCSLE